MLIYYKERCWCPMRSPKKRRQKMQVNQSITFHKLLAIPYELGIEEYANKQRVLMHGHQGWNVRHGLCHIYMRYVYMYELFKALFLLLFVHYCNLMVCVVYWVGKWQSGGSTGMFGNLTAIYHIMLQFIQNHSRFVMLMIWKKSTFS